MTPTTQTKVKYQTETTLTIKPVPTQLRPEEGDTSTARGRHPETRTADNQFKLKDSTHSVGDATAIT